MDIKNILIIGGGWYGCHIANMLKQTHNIIIIEKQNDIFKGSSFFNQNRLHQGYHYCRNFPTRNLCKQKYERFISQYHELVDNIENNYYAISNKSIIDFNTFLSIYNYENFDFEVIENTLFENMDGELIKVKEQVINSNKCYLYFKEQLKDISILYNETFISYQKEHNKIHVKTNKSNYECDMLLDCTYNYSGLSTYYYSYELTCSLLYKKTKNIKFDAITIMDGKFCSLYPRETDNSIYTLTDVEFTPIISSTHSNDILDYKVNTEQINIIKNKMISKIKHYYPDFENTFEYVDYFLANKTKLVSNTDSRDITIEEIDTNVITVNCGKIYGIFEWEDYIKKYLQRYII